MNKSVTIIIDSKLENVKLIGIMITPLCGLGSFTEEEILQIELAVVESVNNVIKHAYNNEPGHDVQIVITLYADRLCIEISDAGRALEPRHMLPGDGSVLEFDPTALAQLPESGLGLAIIHEVMDEVAYRRCRDANTLTLIKRFSVHEAGC